MKALLLLNPGASRGEVLDSALDALRARMSVEHLETASRDDARARAADASRRGTHDVVIAGGGDGTVQAVANGLLDGGARCALGILPLGTGNDTCRSLAIPLDPADAATTLARHSTKMIDVVDFHDDAGSTVFVNLASGGAAAVVTSHVSRKLKERWGALAYIHEAVDVIRELPSWRVQLEFDGGTELVVEDATVVIFGNGRSSAGGVVSAPRANLEDGLVDVIVIRAGPPIDVAAIATRFLFSRHLESERVLHRQVASLTADFEPEMGFSCDGEVRKPTKRLRLTVRPRALRVIVGDDYEPEPRDE